MKNARKGRMVEERVVELLQEMGFACVWPIETGFRFCGPGKTLPVKKVAGDIRAVLPPYGQSVLIESKATDQNKLPYSRLRTHQVDALSKHHYAGGLSLLAWSITQNDLQVPIRATYIMRWPLPSDYFRKGRTLRQDEAESLRYY